MSGASAGMPSETPRRLAVGPAGERPAGPAGTRPASRTDSAAPAAGDRITLMARGFVALFLEVESGRRPRGHLAGLLTPMLYARLCDVWVRGGAPGTVVSVRVTGRSAAGVDVLAMVRRGQRYGAVAVRMVLGSRGWMVDDVALPERGPLPLPAYPVAIDIDDEADDLALVPRPEAAAALQKPNAVTTPGWLPTPDPG